MATKKKTKAAPKKAKSVKAKGVKAKAAGKGGRANPGLDKAKLPSRHVSVGPERAPHIITPWA